MGLRFLEQCHITEREGLCSRQGNDQFYLEANDGSPYKVELIFEEKWYLKSFHFI